MAAKYKFLSDGVTYNVCNRLGENCIGLNRSVLFGSGSLKAEGGGASVVGSVVSFDLSTLALENGNQDLRFGAIVLVLVDRWSMRYIRSRRVEDDSTGTKTRYSAVRLCD
jgi:hypothetical protein